MSSLSDLFTKAIETRIDIEKARAEAAIERQSTPAPTQATASPVAKIPWVPIGIGAAVLVVAIFALKK